MKVGKAGWGKIGCRLGPLFFSGAAENVRYGSFALLLADFRNVCSTPMSGAKADIAEGPESATNGH
jgi:hypothetical protein